MLATAEVAAPYGVPPPPAPLNTPSGNFSPGPAEAGRYSPGHEPLNPSGLMPGMEPDSSANMMTSINALAYATALAKEPNTDPFGASCVVAKRLGPFFSDVGDEHDRIMGTLHSTGQLPCCRPCGSVPSQPASLLP